MKVLDHAQMLEATRLTRAGQLMEAVLLLQRMLGSGTTPSATTEGTPRTRLMEAPTIEGDIVADVPPDLTAARPPGRMAVAALHPLEWKSKFPKLGRKRPLQPAEIAPAVGRYISGFFSNAIGSRSYKLYIPSGHRPGPSPLIVMLHGCTQSADDFAAGTRMNFAAEVRGCFVVYPEQTKAANASKCWNWFRPSDQVRDQGEPALVAGITRQVMKDHNIDPRRVYVAGLSAGGAAAAVMGEAYPDLYAAVGVHSGLPCGSARDLPSAFAAMRGQASLKSLDTSHAGLRLMPTIVFHGDLDKTVHPCNGSQVVARATPDNQFRGTTVRKNTAAGNTYSHSEQRDADGQTVLELWELHGAGHAWSGGSPAGSYTSPAGPNATEEMLRFFLEHRRPLCEGTR
jgi:poly(hydroxyalkanoate) depolymerase family esterase